MTGPAATLADSDRAAVEGATALVDRVLGDARVAIYLTGSAVDGGLRPDSDLDLLVVARRRPSADERQALVRELLRVSGRCAEAGPARPVELTVVDRSAVVPWRYPPRLELQYGEWLRDELESDGPGSPVLGPREEPDLAVLLAQACERSVALAGPPAAAVLDAVPSADLRRAMTDSVPALLADLEGDERNVVLTLARMVATLDLGRIVPKDVAADHLLGLPAAPEGEARAALVLARDAYRGEAVDEGTPWPGEARAFADVAVNHIRARLPVE